MISDLGDSPLAVMLLVTWGAGISALVGGVLALVEGTAETRRKRELVHGIVAFGGGILLAAVAFSLAKEGMHTLSPVVLAVSFAGGGLLFCWLDAYLTRKGGQTAQFVAMLMDFLPEAMALGALFTGNPQAAMLLALYIAAQNLPEGFNSYRDLREMGISRPVVLWVLAAISLLGPLAAACGYFLLDDKPTLTAGIMTFAGGGILYLVFQDIAPKARMRRHWLPTLGAVLGFLFGMIGKQMLG